MTTHFWTAVHSQDPFTHSIFEGYWDPFVLTACAEEFDDIDPISWLTMEISTDDGVLLEKKHSINFDRCEHLLAATRISHRLRDPSFIKYLEAITGIKKLQFDTLGGGLHRISPGGLLRPHIDFNVDHQGRWRRVNVLIYLNSCNGGELRFYGADHTPVKAIKPDFNRMVVFVCSETSWHGHPIPLGDGPDRRSIAAYFFTEDPPPDAAPPHSTKFLRTRQD